MLFTWMLLWTCLSVHVQICMYFHQEVELLGHKVWICSVLIKNTKSFSKLPVPIYILTSNIGVPIIPHPSHIVLSGFSILSILVDLKRCLSVVLISILLKSNVIFSYLYWAFGYPLLRSVCSSLAHLSFGYISFFIDLYEFFHILDMNSCLYRLQILSFTLWLSFLLS